MSWRVTCLLGLLLATSTQAQSLFDEHSWRGWTGDNKAFRPGDVLTVQVLENSSASSSADTGTRRSNRLQAELAHGSNKSAQASLAVAGEFDGGGRTQRASRLLTTVSVVVQEVLPGGHLRVAGTHSLMVNEELQRVTLEGIVRTVDITDANVVSSSRLAEARITYLGEGDVTERSRRAWWRRLLDALGL
ncbi:MAG TPA: flagellar basal body L-ring protein FlgH [Ramlibacter sp.]|uniref:flagellar basal body L-ring protein FlgH n=1 Tax=Ramlibacter sp. TaxID=1917967 RepID=UPI002ED22D43